MHRGGRPHLRVPVRGREPRSKLAVKNNGTGIKSFRLPTDQIRWLATRAAKKKTTETALVITALDKLMHPKK